MQTKFIFILLQLYCLLFFSFSFINGHLSYKYRNRNRSKGSLHNTHTAQALVLAESTSSSSSLSSSSSNLNNHQSQIECDFLNHKETGCEDEIGSRCDPNTSKCVCKESHPVRLLDFCLKLSRLNGPCYTSGQCSSVIANASCYIFGKEYDLDSHNLGRLVTKWPLGVCKCRLGFAYNITTNSCEKRVIGSWCSMDKHCWTIRSLNSISSFCDKKRGECECAWGTRYESKLDTCVPDTTPVNSLRNNGINYPNRQVYYMSKCEQDTDCSLTSTSSSIQTTSSSSSGNSLSSTNSPSIHSTVPSTNSPSSPKPTSVSSSTSSPAVNLIHQPNVQIESNNLLLEQADQENQFNQIRYLHAHRRFKDNLKRLTNYHLRELKCIRGRCICPALHNWDGNLHCREYYDVQSNSSHRHNRKNHNTFTDLDDELNDEFDEDSSVNWQTICLLILGSSLLAGFIFRFCYIRKGEEDDELSEGLRSPDGLYAHKISLGREHPFNPVTVAFLSKPNPTIMNGASCGSNHFDPSYGYIASAAPGCYHEFDYGYGMCNGAAVVAHPMMSNGLMSRGHLQTVNNNSSLGKPPNEEDEDAYLEQNPEERENFEKKEHHLIDSNDGCVQCGQIRINNATNLSLNHSTAEIQPNQCCGCDCTNSLVNKNIKIDTTLTRAILEQYAGTESVAGDSLNSTVGLSTTTTTTGGRTSGNTTNEEDDDEHNKSTAESKSDYIESDLKDEHLSSLLSQATNNLQTSFSKQPSTDLGSEEDSNEDTDEHIAILNRKIRKDITCKKWRTSSLNSAETSTTINASSINSIDQTNNLKSPSKNKSNVPLLLESQTEQFQIA